MANIHQIISVARGSEWLIEQIAKMPYTYRGVKAMRYIRGLPDQATAEMAQFAKTAQNDLPTEALTLISEAAQ